MRRKDREVADLEGQLAILEQCPVCRVAINDPASGVPYLVPLNFGMAAGPQSLTLYFHCAPVGTKLDLLRADPNVSFEADCPGTQTSLQNTHIKPGIVSDQRLRVKIPPHLSPQIVK